ncbi:MAG: RNA 2',3'-cyclic phosphodiesterase [Gammaproteobacteria bacterium]|nr:MAG: RNA 2',3'-cyclic phosphodiesterase [Gammaproteobacteria bacterium]
MTAAARQRLFFALWPDEDTQAALAGLAKARLPAAGGRLISAHNLHLTLVFLGSLDAGSRACAERAAASLRAPAFELEFRRLGYWPRPRLLWSAPERTPEGLTMLESMLRKALAACGHEPESRPFQAHITLARKVRGPIDGTTHASARGSSAIAPGIALPPASDRHGWRECRGLSGTIPAPQSCLALTRPSLDSPLRWPVSAFHLVASQTLANGARYQPLVSWPLE